MATLDEIRARYFAVNGDHPMTDADDEYVRGLFVPLENDAGVHELIEARRLPLPSYLLSDGTAMVHPGFLDNLHAAGGPGGVEDWFRGHWPASEHATAAEEWDAYLSGQYVCLYRVTPQTIRAKTRLIEQIRDLAAHLDGSPDETTRAQLETAVDELDRLEPPFAPHYDRLRFGGPSSREVWIEGMRATHLRPATT